MIILLWAICIVLALLVFIMISGISIYSRIVNRMNNVERAWVNVIAEQRQKNKNIPKLEKAFEQLTLNENTLQKQINEVKITLMRLEVNRIDVDKLVDCEIKSKALVNGLTAMLASHEELKNSVAFNKIMNEICQNERNITDTITVFNQKVNEFNAGIATFPDSFINHHFNKKSNLTNVKNVNQTK